jgi:hypothetical protein
LATVLLGSVLVAAPADRGVGEFLLSQATNQRLIPKMPATTCKPAPTDLDPELTSVEQLTVPTAPGVMSRSLAISVPVH